MRFNDIVLTMLFHLSNLFTSPNYPRSHRVRISGGLLYVTVHGLYVYECKARNNSRTLVMFQPNSLHIYVQEKLNLVDISSYQFAA